MATWTDYPAESLTLSEFDESIVTGEAMYVGDIDALAIDVPAYTMEELAQNGYPYPNITRALRFGTYPEKRGNYDVGVVAVMAIGRVCPDFEPGTGTGEPAQYWG